MNEIIRYSRYATTVLEYKQKIPIEFIVLAEKEVPTLGDLQV